MANVLHWPFFLLQINLKPVKPKRTNINITCFVLNDVSNQLACACGFGYTQHRMASRNDYIVVFSGPVNVRQSVWR